MNAEVLNAVDEKTLQRQVEDLLTIHQWASWHDLSGRTSGNAAKGMCDLIAIRGSRLVALELKTMRGRVAPEQIEWIDRFNGVETVEALIVRPSGFDALSEFLRRPPEQLTISTSNSTDASWNGSAP
jgi:hypothetical protein